MASHYNNVQVVEFPADLPGGGPLSGTRALILDANIHSLYREDQVLLGGSLYWEQLALIADVAPEGPIGILGLGSGTVARMIHHFWPARKMHGWELDATVLHAGREHMGLDDVESSQALACHVGDALSPEAGIEGGFAGVVVDLFADGDVIQPLAEAEGWQAVRRQLRPDGVCIANLARSSLALKHMAAVFRDREMYAKHTELNTLAVAGANLAFDQQRLPADLRHIAQDWRPWEP